MIRGITWTQRSPIPQTSYWSGTFFVVSYSKSALEMKELLLTIKSLLASLAPNQCNVVLRNFAIEAVTYTYSQLLVRSLDASISPRERRQAVCK